MNNNDLIISNLQVLLKEAAASSEVKDRFRAKAYRNAIKQIKNLDYQLESGAQAAKLPGIGKKIADKIQEILDTGKLHQVQAIGSEALEKTQALTLFTKIWGVGPVKAKELWDAGARSISDLQNNPKLQELLTDNQRIGLQYFDDLQKRIPRERMDSVVRAIKEAIRDLNNETGYSIRARVCGSYRRKAPTMGDMDLLVTEEQDRKVLPLIVDKLILKGIISDSLGLGPSKFMGVINIPDAEGDEPHHFRLDIEAVKVHEWPFALLYFTGSGPFNEEQRTRAKNMGYRLSEHGLKDVDTGAFVQGIQHETDIFEALGMKYLPPWERTAK